MKQVELTGIKQFEEKEVERPKPAADQALIKVEAVGICGSDIHAVHGKHPFMSFPIVLGHEATGEVVGTGKDVTSVAVGDRVIYRPQKICGECLQCRTGHYNICDRLEVLGCQDTGASSEYYAVDADLLYRLPDGLGYAEGTLIEPLAVGVHAVRRGCAELSGKKVLVIGAGTIGNLVAQSAKGMGVGAVMITDVSEYKLDMAKACGIDYPVNVSKKDLKDEMTKAFGPDGADVVFECSANEHALNEVLNIARKGITIVIVAVYGGKASVEMANVQDREYSLVGTLMYLHEDYVEAIRLAEEKKVNLEKLISKRFDLTETAQAYQYIDDHKNDVQKVVLNVSHPS